MMMAVQLHLNVTNCCGTVGYQVYGDDDYGDAVRARPWPPVTEINPVGRPRKKAKARALMCCLKSGCPVAIFVCMFATDLRLFVAEK